MRDNILLKVNGLTKSYGDRVVLENIDTEIRKGEVVAIIGPSGCGKSTFLRSLNQMEEISSGSILFDNVEITSSGVDINNIRRELTGKLVEARTKVKRKIIINDVKLTYNEEKNYNYEVSVLVRTKEQLEASISQNVDRIYTPSIELYNKYKDNNKVYLRLPRVVNNYNYDANALYFNSSGNHDIDEEKRRNYGFPIRPVQSFTE